MRNTVSRFRKSLESAVRQGLYKIHVTGSKGNWHLAVARGKSLFRLRSGFATQTAATIHSMMKYGVKPTKKVLATARVEA